MMKRTFVFVLNVEYLKESYKEKKSHKRKWFTVEEAVNMLSEQSSSEAAFFDSFVEEKVRHFFISTYYKVYFKVSYVNIETNSKLLKWIKT